MEIIREINNINYLAKNLRIFGFIISGLLFLYILVLQKETEHAIFYYTIISFISLITIFKPILLKSFYKIWMIAAIIIGSIVATVILIILFLGAICTTGIMAKVFNKKFLHTKVNKKVKSYWILKKLSEIDHNYEKQY